MRRIISVLSVAALMAAMMVVSALPAFAHPVGPHQHFITTPSGETVAVGPDRCAHPETEQGFQQFHHNVHGDRGQPLTPVQEAFADNPITFGFGGCA